MLNLHSRLTSLDVVDSEIEPPSYRSESAARLLQFAHHHNQVSGGLEAVSAIIQHLGGVGGGGSNVMHAFLAANAAEMDIMPPQNAAAADLYNYGGMSLSTTRREPNDDEDMPTQHAQQQQQSAASTSAAEEDRKRKADSDRHKQQALSEALVEHFYRQGMMDVGDQLCREAKLDDLSTSDIRRERYVELNSILSALRQVNLQPALDWAEKHSAELNKLDSLLELKLHRFRFIQLLASGKRAELLAYARVFGKFQQKEQLREVQALMGNLMFVPKDLQDALNHFEATLQPVLLDELCETFIHDSCHLQRIPTDGPVNIALKVGCQAIGPLLNFHSVVGGGADASTRNGGTLAIWDASRPELPVEIPSARDYMFHSVFVCPILRQPTSSKNPPMRLSCGHAISREALNKLSHQLTSLRFKCPYCPKEQDPKEAKQIRF